MKKNADGVFEEQQSIDVSDRRRLNGSRRLDGHAEVFSCPSKMSPGVLSTQVEALEAASEY